MTTCGLAHEGEHAVQLRTYTFAMAVCQAYRAAQRSECLDFFFKLKLSSSSVAGIFFLLLATDEISNATDEVGGIKKIENRWMSSESVLDLQNCSVAFINAKNGFLTKFHIDMVIQKISTLFFFVKKKKNRK